MAPGLPKEVQQQSKGAVAGGRQARKQNQGSRAAESWRKALSDSKEAKAQIEIVAT